MTSALGDHRRAMASPRLRSVVGTWVLRVWIPFTGQRREFVGRFDLLDQLFCSKALVMDQQLDKFRRFLGTPLSLDLDLSSPQLDRACGILLGGATGDALAGTADSTDEWTTSLVMSLPIARAAAAGKDLCARATQREVAAQWRHPITHVLVGAAPLAIAYLDDEMRLIAATIALGRLARSDARTAETCAAWTLTLRHAILTGVVDPSIGLSQITDPDGALRWMTFLESLVGSHATRFSDACNGSDRRDVLAGTLAGACWGASSIPESAQHNIHSRLGVGPRELVGLTLQMLGVDPES